MKKRILFILHMPPPLHGASVVGEYIRRSALVSEAFDCRYINLSTSSSIADIGKVSLAKFTGVFRVYSEARRVLKEFRPALVYVTATSAGFGFLKDSLLVEMIKRMGFPVVVHFHNKGVSARQDFVSRKLYSRFFEGINVIQLSELLYPDIETYVPRKSVRFCPNGVADPGIVQHPENAVPHILFCSNLIESKGILILLDACRILLDKGVRFILDIAGGESSDFTAERLADEISARGLCGVTECHGRVSGDGKTALFCKADIFVHPSFSDCFPLVILEAMACSLPVVSTEEGAIPEIVKEGETGMIVPRKNPVATAGALEKMLSDKTLRTEMGERGRARYEALYTLDRFEYRFTELLNDLCTDSSVRV